MITMKTDFIKIESDSRLCKSFEDKKNKEARNNLQTHRIKFHEICFQIFLSVV